MERLDEAGIRHELATVPGWQREGDAIVRTFAFGTFPEALAFVMRVGELAERAGHHPDIDIRYAKVRLLLTTHDAGGLSTRDFALAREISRLP